MAVPYSLEYQGELARVAALLREAAALTTQPTLKAYLETRAAALAEQRLLRQRRRLDGARRQHRADHRALRGLRGRVVQLQGGLRGVHHRARRRRDAEAGALRRRAAGASRTTCRSTRSSATRSSGALAPIRVVNTVFSSGDGNRGVQTAAFNLPNDERVVTAEKGTKRVMLKNVQEAKFAHGAAADRQGGAAGRRPGATWRSTRSSPTS